MDAGKSEMEALVAVYTSIVKLAPHLPVTHRGDAHKLEFLRSAVVGRVWAVEPLSSIATNGLSFQQL